MFINMALILRHPPLVALKLTHDLLEAVEREVEVGARNGQGRRKADDGVVRLLREHALC